MSHDEDLIYKIKFPPGAINGFLAEAISQALDAWGKPGKQYDYNEDGSVISFTPSQLGQTVSILKSYLKQAKRDLSEDPTYDLYLENVQEIEGALTIIKDSVIGSKNIAQASTVSPLVKMSQSQVFLKAAQVGMEPLDKQVYQILNQGRFGFTAGTGNPEKAKAPIWDQNSKEADVVYGILDKFEIPYTTRITFKLKYGANGDATIIAEGAGSAATALSSALTPTAKLLFNPKTIPPFGADGIVDLWFTGK